MKIQVAFGVGAPKARQLIVASFPSRTVTLDGATSITGCDAEIRKLITIKKIDVQGHALKQNAFLKQPKNPKLGFFSQYRVQQNFHMS